MGEKMSDPESGRRNSRDQETAFNDQDETVQFLPKSKSELSNGPALDGGANGSAAASKKGEADEFYGLTREQLQDYASDPKWVKIRIILFVIFVICWAAMLVAAIVIVVLTPKCPPTPNLSWYQSGVAYRVLIEKFQDSDGDGNGDIRGIIKHVDHLADLKVKTLWLKDAMDADDMKKTKYGSLDDLRELAKTLKKKGVRLVVDLNVKDFGHFSDKHTISDKILHSGNDGALKKLEEIIRFWTGDGVEGYVVYLPDDIDQTFYSNLTQRWQEILDVEFNKNDDRERLIILGDQAVDLQNVRASLYKPHNCTDASCEIQDLKEMATASQQDPWKIPQMVDLKSPICSLVQRLTVAGTPNVVYGDEIGFTGSIDNRGTMVWDDSKNHGFTNSSDLPQANVSSVLAQKSVGYSKLSQYNLFKQLAEARYKEPSLKWGLLKIHEFAVGTISYVRDAEGFSPVVVAMNPTDSGKSGKLVYNDFSHGQVLAVSGVNLEVGVKVDLSAVYLPEGSVLVARLEKHEETK